MAEMRVRRDLSETRAYEAAGLGRVQAVLRTASELPDGFFFPSVAEMTAGGPGVCEHPWDMEHEQEAGGLRLLTSVVWVSDAGMWEFPDGTTDMGCQWVARVTEWPWWPGSWDSECDSDLLRVVMDCRRDADKATAAAEALRLLGKAVAGRF